MQVQPFLVHLQGGEGNASQGMWLQQATALFIQSGVQLLSEFKHHAEAWANTSLVRSSFSQPNQTLPGPLGSPVPAPLGHQRSTGRPVGVATC